MWNRGGVLIKKLTIAFQGGLGNQLFHWALAHTLLESADIRVDLLDKPGKDIELNKQVKGALSPLLANCEHLTFESPLSRKYFHFLNRAWQFYKSKSLFRNLRYFREFPMDGIWNNEIALEESRYAYGYFQDKNYVAKAISYIESELAPVVRQNLERLNRRLEIPEEYAAIHVRRYPVQGVRLLPHVIGNLDRNYYLSWIERQNPSIILILVRDIIDLKFLGKLPPSCVVIDQQTANPWETLGVMQQAKWLLCSNSSMSWWGGFLAASKGNEVFLPSDWSVWGNVKMSNLYFDNALSYPAKWDTHGYKNIN